MITKRQWLAERGLAKPEGRGRFSTEAMAALEKAISEGVEFSDNTPASKPKGTTKQRISEKYDAKKIRRWAAQQGISLGERGRIPAEIVNRYFDEAGSEAVEAPVAVEKPVVAREKVREQTVAWGFARRPQDAPVHISEPVVAISNCGRCGEGVAYCVCTSGPYVPSYLTNGVSETALLTKPE